MKRFYRIFVKNEIIFRIFTRNIVPILTQNKPVNQACLNAKIFWGNFLGIQCEIWSQTSRLDGCQLLV